MEVLIILIMAMRSRRTFVEPGREEEGARTRHRQLSPTERTLVIFCRSRASRQHRALAMQPRYVCCGFQSVAFAAEATIELTGTNVEASSSPTYDRGMVQQANAAGHFISTQFAASSAYLDRAGEYIREGRDEQGDVKTKGRRERAYARKTLQFSRFVRKYYVRKLALIVDLFPSSEGRSERGKHLGWLKWIRACSFSESKTGAPKLFLI